MLKIALVRWKAKCPRHPCFNPDTDGAGAIHGNCVRCQKLQAIYENHSRTLKLIRAFGPAASSRRVSRTLLQSSTDREQLMLFSERLFDDTQPEQDGPARAELEEEEK